MQSYKPMNADVEAVDSHLEQPLIVQTPHMAEVVILVVVDDTAGIDG